MKKAIRQQVIAKLKAAMDLTVNSSVKKGQLKVGKKKRGNVSADNIISGKRKRKEKDKSLDFTLPTADPNPNADISQRPKPPKQNENSSKDKARSSSKKKSKSKGGPRINVGDVVSLPATAFDGDLPGSYSAENPEPSFGRVKKISKNGMAEVEWFKDENEDDWVSDEMELCRVKDLTLEIRKATASNIIVLLVEGEQVAFEHADKNNFPKNFFELLVKHDWRKWVESVKKELEGWDANNAVTVVDIKDVPKNAKVVPLGELYSIKRDGRYKFRQYLMGNLLREGVDYQETFSTTVSGSGLCTFYSLATTCEKEIWGWDAVCGYLQSKEQYDVYAFLPSHHAYSSLEYEELAVLRKEFLELVSKEGVEGLKKFAAKHKRDSRTNPKEVYKCNSSIYGAPSAGHEFELLIHSVHTETCGCTQTQPEPSIYVKIVVDKNDCVVGYLIAAAFVDDLRFFGTEPERVKYMADVKSRLKVTFEEPPVTEFVSIETYQCMKTNTCELKMPRYFKKAAVAFASFFPKGLKERVVPMSVADEKLVGIVPTEEEILEAKYLPFRQILGVLSYPASQCHFAMKYSISVLGSRRGGWNKEQFEVLLKVFEYGVHTCEIGVIYSKGLDPHGDNTLYAYADASLSLPRSYGCRITMMNGGAVLFKAKKQALTAPSTVWSEMEVFYDQTTDVLGLRNLLAELGMYQQRPTPIYGDNESQQKIANNRGSLGQTSRAMDLKTLASRNRIEDHQVETRRKKSANMPADIGTKALPEEPFVRLRDIANGYSLVKAAYPNFPMSNLVYSGVAEGGYASLQDMQRTILGLTIVDAAEQNQQ